MGVTIIFCWVGEGDVVGETEFFVALVAGLFLSAFLVGVAVVFGGVAFLTGTALSSGTVMA